MQTFDRENKLTNSQMLSDLYGKRLSQIKSELSDDKTAYIKIGKIPQCNEEVAVRR